MTALFRIAAESRAQLEAMADLDLDEQTVQDTIENLQGDLHDKLRACIAYSQELSILQYGAAAAAKRMADRAEALGKRRESLLAYVLTHMQGTNTPSISTDEWECKVAKKPPAVQIAADAVIPARYMRTPPAPAPQPDKVALKQALQGGQEIPGVSLVTGYRIAIK